MSATSTISSRANLLGPLTTTWSAPSPCQSAWQDCATCTGAWQGQACLDDGSNQDALTCWPPVAETTSALQAPFLGLGFYSPGLACPMGYETACAMSGASNGLQQTISGQQQFQFEFAPTAGETVIGCCPSGYACATGNNGQTCSLQIASTTEPLLTCATGASTITTSIILPETVTTTASSSIVGLETITQFVIWAPLFQLNYQPTDLPTSSTLSTAPVTPTAALPSNTTSSASSGSSHTTTIAVAVTVPVVVVALIAAMLGWWFWRRRASPSRGSYAAPPAPDPDDRQFYAPTELSSHNALVEMASPNNPVPPVEMSHESNVPKPFQAAAVHEMDG